MSGAGRVGRLLLVALVATASIGAAVPGSGSAATSGDVSSPVGSSQSPSGPPALEGSSAPAAAQAPSVSIRNVSVAPTAPAPDEPVTVDVTVANGGRTAYWIEAVALRPAPDDPVAEYTRVPDVGTLTPGSRVQVPLTHRFETAGTHRLRAVVYFQPDDGVPRRVVAPVVVEVAEPNDRGPTVDVDVGRAVVGSETTVDVRVVNDLDSSLVGGALSLSAPGVDVADDRRAFATVERGEALNASFEVVPTRTGRSTATLALEYTRGGGETRRVTRQVPIEVAAGRVRLDARVNATDAGRVVVATVLNRRSDPVTGLRIRDRSDNVSLTGRLDDPVPPGATRTVRLPLAGAATGEGAGVVPLEATYRVDGRVGRSRTRVRVSDPPAEVTLTGVVVQRQGDRVHISGSASNVGLQPAQGVLVGVVDGRRATPAAPQRDYFVGEVGVSNFVAFDVYATVQSGVEAVPVRVSYSSDGRRRTTVVEVPIGDGGGAAAASVGPGGPGGDGGGNPEGRPGGGSSGGGPLSGPLSLVGAILGVVVLAAGGYVVVRRRRGGDGN